MNPSASSLPLEGSTDREKGEGADDDSHSQNPRDIITALQEAIGTSFFRIRFLDSSQETTLADPFFFLDGLSLAMFEALRGLRDAAGSDDAASSVPALVEGVWTQSRRMDALLLLLGGIGGSNEATRSQQIQRLDELLRQQQNVATALVECLPSARAQQAACRLWIAAQQECFETTNQEDL